MQIGTKLTFFAQQSLHQRDVRKASIHDTVWKLENYSIPQLLRCDGNQCKTPQENNDQFR